MAKKRHVYSKDQTGFGDFIYVDLLPEVKRARQFNVNVVVALLFAVILGFFLIYRPYRDATFELEEVTSRNNDLKHELTLTEEEFEGYEIDLSAIRFEEDIEAMRDLSVNFNNLIDDVHLIVDDNNGRIRNIAYDAVEQTMIIEISIVSQFSYNSLNNQLLNLSWVQASAYSTPTRPGGDVEYTSRFEIEVNFDVE